jgi:hypothetical protein
MKLSTLNIVALVLSVFGLVMLLVTLQNQSVATAVGAQPDPSTTPLLDTILPI